MSNNTALVELPELSRTLRLSRRWLRHEVAAGRIPCLKAGHKRLFNVDAVRNALAARAAGEAVRDGR